jgi:hypothetical protein
MMRDAWLTATKHQRPGLPVGKPLKEAEHISGELMLQVHALIPGK